MNDDDIRRLANSAEVVVFRSPLTDLGDLDHLLDRLGIKWRTVDLAMGERENRASFEVLRSHTGHPTLPQVFVDGHFVGGLEAARSRLEDEAALAGPSPRLSPPATLAAYAGLVPFIGLAAWLWIHGGIMAARVLAIYAATVLSFIGAVHWGWALGEHAEPRRYYWSIAPALAGWILASLPPAVGLPILAASFIGLWYAERRWFATDLPGWYRALRLQLSFITAACLVAAWIAVLI